ncbi:MAG: DedA family protein [DPANN group archaeon]|nr:DedA family protein [DPANN group archaeon]
MPIINFLLQYAEHLGYLAVYGLITGSSFGLPIPEDATLLVAGYAASQHYIKLPLLMIVAVLGILTGDNLGFYIGRKYKNDIHGMLFKHGHKIFLTAEKVNKIYMTFRKHPDWTIFLSRFVVGLRFIAPLIAGSSGMRWREFFLFNLIGALFVGTLIPLAGWYFGANLAMISKFVKDFYLIITIIAVAIIIPAIFMYQKKRRATAAKKGL